MDSRAAVARSKTSRMSGGNTWTIWQNHSRKLCNLIYFISNENRLLFRRVNDTCIINSKIKDIGIFIEALGLALPRTYTIGFNRNRENESSKK